MSTVLGLNLASQGTAGMISQCLCGFSPVASSPEAYTLAWLVCVSCDGRGPGCAPAWMDGSPLKPTTLLSGPSLVSSRVPWEEADMCFPRSPSRHRPDIQQRGRLSSTELQITATNYTNSRLTCFFFPFQPWSFNAMNKLPWWPWGCRVKSPDWQKWLWKNTCICHLKCSNSTCQLIIKYINIDFSSWC